MNNAHNPDWYVELYDKYQLKPHPGSHGVTNGYTCALGVALVECGIEATPPGWLQLLGDKLGVTRYFLHGVMLGFDNGHPECHLLYREPEVLIRNRFGKLPPAEFAQVLAGTKVGREVHRKLRQAHD